MIGVVLGATVALLLYLINSTDQKRKLKIKKILLIHGGEDTAAPIENVEELLPLFNNASFKKLPEAGHQVYLAEPEKVWSLINNFLGEINFSKNR